MFLLLHIIIALTSVAWTTITFFVPSTGKLRVGYSLVALTLGSGTYLVVSLHANMLQSCLTGLIYTASVSLGIWATHHKLAIQKVRNKIN